MYCAQADWSERAPVIDHECTVLGRDMNVQRTNSGGKRGTYVRGYVPIVQVRLVVSNATHWAKRYRLASSRFDGRGYSQFQVKDEAEDFLGKFTVGESTICYQFEDGTVKLEKDPPELTVGTRVFYALSSLTCGLACIIACCAIMGCYADPAAVEQASNGATSDVEAGHVGNPVPEHVMYIQTRAQNPREMEASEVETTTDDTGTEYTDDVETGLQPRE